MFASIPLITAKAWCLISFAVLPSLVRPLPLPDLDTLAIAGIERTLNRFSLAVDTHDYSLLQLVFTNDAIGIFGAETPAIQGLAAIEQALKASVGGSVSQHALSTQIVDINDDQSAFAISYLQGTFFGTGNLTGQTYTTYGR